MNKLLILFIVFFVLVLSSGCVSKRGATLKNLNDRNLLIEKNELDNVSESEVMASYHAYLGDAPANHPMYTNALNRLADLEMKAGDDKLLSGQDEIFQQALQAATRNATEQGQQNYENAIELYTGLLNANPNSPRNDWVLYQLASAYEKIGKLELALKALEQLVSKYPSSEYFLEAQFRLGDIYFLLQDFMLAEKAFKSVLTLGKNSVYYNKSVYKYGWSLFKQEHYDQAMDAFFVSLQTLNIVYDLQEKIDTRALSRVEKDMLDDIFRAINLCISYGGGVRYATRYFDKHSKQPFEYEVFKRLGDYFIEHKRIKDAADSYGVFVERQPFHPMAPSLQVARINAYDSARFGKSALLAREEFVTRFGVESAFWQRQNSATKAILRGQAKSILNDLSEYYHARLQRNRKNVKNFDNAVYWYTQYIKTFPGELSSAKKQFLLGELYSEKRKYRLSADAYLKAAYEYPVHEYAQEAAYAAVEAYQKLFKQAGKSERSLLREQLVAASIKFVDAYPEDKRTLAVHVRLVEELFSMKRYDDALKHANLVLAAQKNHRKIKNKHVLAAYIVIGHIAFDRQDYLKAQSAYQQVLHLGVKNTKLKKLVKQRLAAATYKYAEEMSQQGNLLAAAESFIRVTQISEKSNISAQAQYDAATAYIKLEKWRQAIKVLEHFRKTYPKHKLQSGVTDKLAVCYEKNGQYARAATEILKIGKRSSDPKMFKRAVLQAATLYEKSKNLKLAVKTYKFYVRSFNLALEESLEGKQKLVDLYAQMGQQRKRRFWQKKIAASKFKDNQISDRGKYIIASAAIELADEKEKYYEKVALKLPLKTSLKKKQKLMKSALRAYEKVSAIGVQEFTTAATYKIADIYQHLGSAIMKSQRPVRLTSEEREEYDLLLEEQAYPFEEKAIALHELNVNRMVDGVYDNWVQKSISRLAIIQPARYGKEEVLEEMYVALD